MIKPEWIREIEEREAKATKGPWDCHAAKFPEYEDDRPGTWYLIDTGEPVLSVRDAKFITHASTDIPALLSALNKAMEAIEEAPHGQYCWLQHKSLPQECSCWKYQALEAINNPTQKENSHER